MFGQNVDPFLSFLCGRESSILSKKNTKFYITATILAEREFRSTTHFLYPGVLHFCWAKQQIPHNSFQGCCREVLFWSTKLEHPPGVKVKDRCWKWFQWWCATIVYGNIRMYQFLSSNHHLGKSCPSFQHMSNMSNINYQWIGLREHLQESPMKFMGKSMVSPISWKCGASLGQSPRKSIQNGDP